MAKFAYYVFKLFLVVGVLSFDLATCYHRGGGHGGRNVAGGGPSDNSWTPTSLDCSQSASVNNTFCDKMLESLLGIVLGVPPSIDRDAPLSAQLLNESGRKRRQSESNNSNATQICCFLMSFPSARENCCQQVTKFCDGIFGPDDVCSCLGWSGDNNEGTSYGNYGRVGGGHGRRHGGRS